MEQREQASLIIAKMIRDRSETRRLVRFEEILTELSRQGLLQPEMFDQTTDFESMIKEVVKDNEDLREVSGRNEILYYYSAQSLSETYAGLLVAKEESPAELIAQIVRENSATYPRPVSSSIFEESPFDLTREEISECLGEMSRQGEYQDIGRTTTSIGTVFLFSSRHLDPDYASSLAEWLDVGQVNNP